jgi:hypothetical protein
MLDWFVPGRVQRSEVDALGAATTIAIRELLTLLRRLTEQATRPVNRASELRETAAWFAACTTDDEAHTLFDAAFGLSPVDHVGLTVPDVDVRRPVPELVGRRAGRCPAVAAHLRAPTGERRHRRSGVTTRAAKASSRSLSGSSTTSAGRTLTARLVLARSVSQSRMAGSDWAHAPGLAGRGSR